MFAGLCLGLIAPVAARPIPETKPSPDLASTTTATPLPSAKPRRGTPPARPEQTRLPAQHEILSAADREIGRKAFQEAAASRFDAARRIAATAKEPMIAQLVRWLWLQSANSGAGFEEITKFIDSKPDWPAREALLRRADEAIDGGTPDGRILAWFDAHPPETGLGLLRLGETLLRLSREADAFPVMRRAWVDGNLSLRDEKVLWAEFGQRFSVADNAARTDRLLWDGNIEAARRMLPRLDAESRLLAEARIALANNVASAEKLVTGLPAHLQDDGGLNYDRLRWQRKRGMNDGVEALLYNAPDDLGRAEKWWVERHFRARKALVEGRISEAYRLAAGHGLKGGGAKADAEWLAGWIALRLLQEPKAALKHFTALQDSVRFPVSLSRAAYWLGRTHTALGDTEQARHSYEQAALHGTTFYGQLAAHELDAKRPLDLPDVIQPTAEQARQFQRREVVRAAQILVELDQEERLRPFIMRLVHTAKTPEEHKLVAQLARNLRRVDLAVASSKRSARQGIILLHEAYPLVEPMLRVDDPETALVLALSRQESEFNQTAVSPAGARGLMQLMPATAKGIAKELKLGFDQNQLTRNAGYNVQLGSHYLKGLLRNWDNNFVLALAGYNAGEARVRRWIQDWGDPRQPNVDVIDWIELIPFSETRNYVQRVLESVQVYRHLLQNQPGSVDRIYIDMRGLPRQACSTSPC
ncbi:lytic transglycosylase domain-containing protein [Ferrovibrio sp.]|uniref:lytic transglycosylase domain-containing protein n=1 Tax=Ferrovibrio sp. TaxID=1917215 RepID=UPI000CBDBBF3|nr:transglycosylase SLT domain-containing protein [Ferrovibrio sp.]PJI37766.1 MAG: murein transglycosylase [Ferrovibrio sp.]